MIELIKKRIEENRLEIATLQSRHDAMVAQMQQNQNRYQQLIGAIAELELLVDRLNQLEVVYGTNNGERHPGARSHDPAG